MKQCDFIIQYNNYFSNYNYQFNILLKYKGKIFSMIFFLFLSFIVRMVDGCAPSVLNMLILKDYSVHVEKYLLNVSNK